MDKTYNQCDWKKLKAEKETFTNQQADLIFSVPLKAKPQSKIKIVILLEHKSYYNKSLFKQILNYQNAIYQKETSNDIIAVVPILFYHGEIPWRWKQTFKEGYCGKDFSDIPLFFRENMLNYKLIVFDTNDPKIRRFFKDKRIKSRGALRVLSEIWDLEEDVSELLEIVSLFADFPERQKKEFIVGLWNYLKRAGKISLEVLGKVEKKAIEEGILKKGGHMRFTEMIKKEARLEGLQEGRQEGMQRGIQEGQQKGLQKGLQEGRQQVILNMLKKKADISFISEVTGLSKKEINKLKKKTQP